jgi:signal peptidase I
MKLSIGSPLVFVGLFCFLLCCSGCAPARPEAPSSSLSRDDAQRAAKAVSFLINGRVCSIAASGSMRPSFNEAAFVVTEPVPMASVRLGDIIVKRADNGMLIVHRVIRIESEGLVTRGDANDSEDPGFTTAANLDGRVVAVVFSKGRS